MIRTQDIKEHMEATGSDGQHVGIVDHPGRPGQNRLTKSDPKAGGQHDLIPLTWVDCVDAHVHHQARRKDAKVASGRRV